MNHGRTNRVNVNPMEDSFNTYFDRLSPDEDMSQPLNHLFYRESADPYYQENIPEIPTPVFKTINVYAAEDIISKMDVRGLTNFLVGNDEHVERYWPMVLRTFKIELNGIITINRHELESGSYEELLTYFQDYQSGVCVNCDGGQIPFTEDQIEDIVHNIFVFVTLEYISITDVEEGRVVRNFIRSHSQIVLGYTTQLHLKISTYVNEERNNSKVLPISRYENLEILTLAGNIIFDGRIYVKNLKALSLKKLRQVSLKLPLNNCIALNVFESCLQLADLEIIGGVRLNELIEYLASNENIPKTLKKLRFVGDLENGFRDITSEMTKLVKLKYLDIRLRDAMPEVNVLCTDDNVNTFICLQKLKRLILVEENEQASNRMVFKLFERLPRLRRLYAQRIVRTGERRDIRHIRPTYRRIDKYISVVD